MAMDWIIGIAGTNRLEVCRMSLLIVGLKCTLAASHAASR